MSGKTFGLLFMVVTIVAGCAASPPQSTSTIVSSNKAALELKAARKEKAKLAHEEIFLKKQKRKRTVGEKAKVVLSETGKGAIKGAVAGGVTGIVMRPITNQKTEAPVVGGVAGAVLGAGHGLAEGIKKSKEPVEITTKTVTISSGIEGMRSVFPRRNQPYVLRIWIAPWRDEKDRLRWSRFLFEDLSVGRWNLGERPEVLSRKDLLELLSNLSTGKIQYLRKPKGTRRPTTAPRHTKPQ